MGEWGTGIFSNDISQDVRDDYISKLKAGKSDEAALKEILSEYCEPLQDDDDKYDVIFGLAATMWKKGRLTEEVKRLALEAMEEEQCLERWESEKLKKARKKELEKLKTRLNSEMPQRTKISIHKPYVLGWEKGDVYAFQIKSKVEGYEEYVGWYALMYVDKIIQKDWYVHGVYDEVAEVYMFLTEQKPQDENAIKTATPVCFFRNTMGNRYKEDFLETSKRTRPKDFIFIGKCLSFEYPKNEYYQKSVLFWGDLLERDILWGYKLQLEIEKEEN